MTSYVADLDLKGHEMERPYLRVFLNAEDDADATKQAQEIVQADETVRGVQPLSALLDPIRDKIAAGGRFTITQKSEAGTDGPVWISDLDAMPAPASGVIGVPFGSAPEWETELPWMTRSDAKRLAQHLGLKLETT